MIGLWISKTGNGNAWYHIFPFVKSRYTKKLYIVRYAYPQRLIQDRKAHFQIFQSKGYLSEMLNFFWTGFKILRTKEIDYIVSFNLVPWASIAWILAKLFKKPIIIGLIGTDFNKYIQKKNNGFFFWILKHTDVITVTGSKMMAYFNDESMHNKVFIFPHCLPDDWYKEEYSKPNIEFELISVCSLTQNKRTIDILKALHLLRSRNLDLKLRIVGIGSEEASLKFEVEKLGLSDNVEFVGYQSEIKEQMQKAKLFVQASIKEGLSLSLLEAIGAGIVPVITEAGSEKDIIAHDVNGLFFRTFDVKDLADQIEYALKTENYCRIQDSVLETKKSLRIRNAIRETEKIQKYLLSIYSK